MRNCLLRLCLALPLLSVSCSAPESAPPAPLAMFRGDTCHGGVYPGPEPRELPAVKWCYRTTGRIFSSPTLAGETLYFGGEDSCLHAVDRRDGSLRWSYRTGGPVRSTPAVAEGLVFFVSGDGCLYALRAEDGELAWSYRTGGERRYSARGLFGLQPADREIEDAWDFYHSSPAVADGTVYFGAGDSCLYALEAAGGRELWRYRTGGVVHSSPAVSGGRVFVGSWDGCLYALEAAGGALLWKYQTGLDESYHLMTGIQGSPAVAGELVLFGARDANLYALEAADGRERWKFSTSPSWIIASPAVADSLVYFGTSDSHLLLAVELSGGREVFRAETAGLFLFSSPAVVGQSVIFGGFEGGLYALDRRTGAQRWRWRTEASLRDSLGLLLPDGALDPKAFREVAGGEQMEQAVRVIHSLGSILSSPVAADGELYFCSTDGCLYALH